MQSKINSKQISVLIIDDNPTFLGVVSSFLDLHGFNVLATAEGGREGLEKVRDLAPDIALVDLSMPQFSGVELIPRIREMRPDIGIIVLTFWDTEGYRRISESNGADHFIPKSAVKEELLDVIKMVYAKRSAKGRMPGK